jgi:hypothetical protein
MVMSLLILNGVDTFSIISLVFGTGGIGYAIISKILDRKKYAQEVRDASAQADLKGDEFWKKRYDVLQQEVESKNAWWKERYDTLYTEYQHERKLSNDIIVSFRSELNDMRTSYEEQRELEKQKYGQLLEQYHSLEEESQKREREHKQKILQLEEMIAKYEIRLNKI